MKKLLIFGAEGQLGRAFLGANDPEFSVIGVSRAEADITDLQSVTRTIESANPDIVINVAAYNQVEAANENAREAYAVNALGAYVVAKAAAQKKVPVIFISSDYVFDGTRRDGYTEDAVTHPLNVYGASKDAGEKLVRIATPSHWIIRTSALFGDRGKGGKGYNFVTKMLEVGKSAAARVVSDQWTCPTYTVDLAAGILSLIKKNISYGTYHLVNEGNATWHEFAEKIYAYAGMTVSVSAISTEESGTKIMRPRFSVLRNVILAGQGITLPSWEDALERYLKASARVP